MTLDEFQELAILIADPADAHRLIERTGHQRVVGRPRHRSVGIGNRIAVRIHFGPSQHFVDAVDQPIRDRVLQQLRFVVDFGPAHSHHLHEKELYQAVASQDQSRQLLPGLGQPHARIRLVSDQS